MAWKCKGAMLGGLGASSFIFHNRFAGEWVLGTDVSGVFIQPSPLTDGWWTGHMMNHTRVPPNSSPEQWFSKAGAYWADAKVEVDISGYEMRGGVFVRDMTDRDQGWRNVTTKYNGWLEGDIAGFRCSTHRRISVLSPDADHRVVFACVIDDDGDAGMIRYDAMEFLRSGNAGLTPFDFDKNRLWACLGKDPNRVDVLYGCADRHPYGGGTGTTPKDQCSPGVWAMLDARNARSLVRLDGQGGLPQCDSARTFLVVDEGDVTVIYLSVVSDDSNQAARGIWRGEVQGQGDEVTGCSWTNITRGLNLDQDWVSIAGGRKDGHTVLFLGNRDAQVQLGGKFPTTGKPFMQTHVRNTDAAGSGQWESISGPDQAGDFTLYATQDTWIAKSINATAQAGVGGNAANIFDLDYDYERDVLISAQKTGPWVLESAATAPFEEVHWQPITNGNGAIWVHQVEVHPKDPSKVAITDTDRSCYTFIDGQPKIHMPGLDTQGHHKGRSLFIKPDGAMLWGRDDGAVARHANPWTGDVHAWEVHAGPPGADDGDGTDGVAEFDAPDGRVIRLALVKSGIWRAVDSWSWTKVLPLTDELYGSVESSRFLCRDDDGIVYLLTGDGLMRSKNAGQTWTRIAQTGTCLARLESAPNKLWLATANGLFKVTKGAETPTVVKMTAQGVLGANDDCIGVAVDQASGRIAVLVEMNEDTPWSGVALSEDDGATWHRIAEGPTFDEYAPNPWWLAFGGDAVYVSSRSQQVLKFIP